MPDKKFVDSLINVFGILSIGVVLYNVIKEINKETRTDVISKNAVKTINSPEESLKLREALDEYHKTGKWSETSIKDLTL